MAIALRKSDKTIKGGEIVARMLAAEGVEKVFGIVDGTYMGFFSAFKKLGIELVSPRHESSAAHMAGAYARATGKLGVCMASNGPGVANVLPGVAVENAEGNRVLLITSTRRVPIGYPDRGGTFQWFPQVDVIRPMSKFSCVVPSPDRVSEIMKKALRASWSGRPGVVHVDVPENIMNGDVETSPAWFGAPESYRTVEAMVPPPGQVKEAARLLAEAKRPVIHVGSGVLHAAAFDELISVAEVLHAPVTTSWGARTCIDERHELSIPMVALEAVNKARSEADLVLVVGSRLGETDWWGKPPYWGNPLEQKTIHVDLDDQVLGGNRPATLAIHSDAKTFLGALAAELAERHPPMPMDGRRKFAEACRGEAVKIRAKLDKKLDDQRVPMVTAHVPSIAQQAFGDDAFLVIDGGNTAVWTNFFTEVRRTGSIHYTNKMGHLGAGVPHALGVKVAFPDRPVYCVIGDGAFGFQPQEIETAVRNGLNVVYFVICDKQWGMVKMTQQIAMKPLKTIIKKRLDESETINADLHEIEFDQLARSMGAHGERVADPAGLKGAIERCVASGKPAVIHVDVDQAKHLWAPALAAFKDMHGEPRG